MEPYSIKRTILSLGPLITDAPCCVCFFSYPDRIIPPSFTRKLKETNGLSGSSVVMECKVYGSPPISVVWFHDGNEISSGRKYQTTLTDNTCALTVNMLEESDSGNYTCIATNVAGSDECSAPLTVRGRFKSRQCSKHSYRQPRCAEDLAVEGRRY